jgi:hypothetical protein
LEFVRSALRISGASMKAVAPLAAGLSLLTLNLAVAAPPQLLNKSVVITWSESIQEKGEDGRVINTPATRERIAHVSSAGRVFVRATNHGPGGWNSKENAPGAAPGSLAFQGSDTMVGTSVFAGFARRLTVTFDASFSSCSAAVVYGKSDGPRKWKSFDGTRTYEALSIAVGSTSCSIRVGNTFAS